MLLWSTDGELILTFLLRFENWKISSKSQVSIVKLEEVFHTWCPCSFKIIQEETHRTRKRGRHTWFRYSGGTSAPFSTSMVVKPVSSVIMSMSRPGLVSELATLQLQEPSARSSSSKNLNKLSLSCFLEFFCINTGSIASANWTLGAFGKNCKLTYIFLFDLWLSVEITGRTEGDDSFPINQKLWLKCDLDHIFDSCTYYSISTITNHYLGFTCCT